MGDLRPENGGGLPPDDGGSQPNGLPEIPPEWGPVVIPNDAADLADESASVRRELRRERRHNRVRRLFGLPPVKLTRGEPSQSLAVPLFIMFTAVVITLVSLFVVTWDRSPAGQQTTTGATSGPATPALTGLTLTDRAGHPVRLGSLLPAVVLLVDDCACTDLITQTAAAAGPGVTVLAVARTTPKVNGETGRIRALADPNGQLRGRFATTVTPQVGTATAVLVNAQGNTVAVVNGVRTVDAVKPSLPALTAARQSTAPK